MDKCKHFVKNRDGVYYCDSKKCMSRIKSKCTLYHGYDKKADKLNEFMEKEASKFGVYKCLAPVIDKNSVEMKALELACECLNGKCLCCPMGSKPCPDNVYLNRMVKKGPCYIHLVKWFLNTAKGGK